MEFHLTAMGRHLPYGITQCYLPPDTSACAPPSPQPVSRYSIYLPRRDERLSWPRLPGNAPAGNRTRDLSITSPMPYHYTNRATCQKCQKEATWNTIFSIFERWRGPQTSRGPGKLFPLPNPPSLSTGLVRYEVEYLVRTRLNRSSWFSVI